MTSSMASHGVAAPRATDGAVTPGQAAAAADTRVAALFVAAALALLAIAAFSFPYAPLQDFPEWVYQADVFNKLAAGASSPLFELKHYPVPYSLLQLILSGLLLVVPPMAASRLAFALYGLAALLIAQKFMARNRIEPSIGWPILLSAALFNAPFWSGYMGYQSGVIVLLAFLALPRERRSDWRWVLPFSVLAFFAHGWDYVALLAFIGAYALHDRRIFSCGAALLPSLGLLAAYEKFNTPSQMWVMFDFDHVNPVLYKIYTVLKTAPYHNAIVFDFNAATHFGALYVGAGLALDALFLLAILALALAAARAVGAREILRRPETLTGGALLALGLALPPTLFDWGNPGERLIIPALVALSMAFFDGFRPQMRAVRISLAASLLGGWALFGLGLVAGGKAYENGPPAMTNAPAPARAADTGSKANWFGHRLAQFDDRMKIVESAWRAGTMPTTPLSFETGLIVSKKP